jgi:hypothetical protein
MEKVLSYLLVEIEINETHDGENFLGPLSSPVQNLAVVPK